jgi:hypothetical protein
MKHTGLKKNEMVIGYNYWVNNELLGLVKIMDGLFIFHKKTGNSEIRYDLSEKQLEIYNVRLA